MQLIVCGNLELVLFQEIYLRSLSYLVLNLHFEVIRVDLFVTEFKGRFQVLNSLFND